MTAEHEVFSDEYMNSRTKQYKQGIALFTVLTVSFGVIGTAVLIAAIVMDHGRFALNGVSFVILSFVSIGIVANARGRLDTLLENKRLWDRVSS